MKAGKDKVIEFHYRLRVDGAEFESSHAVNQTVWALLGYGQLIPGLERALEGHEAGAQIIADIDPVQGYGERNEGMSKRVPKKYFRDAKQLRPGMTTVLALKEGGQRPVVVEKVGMTTVDVNFNHPLAGKALRFEVELKSVRQASEEERAHGHVHAPGDEAH